MKVDNILYIADDTIYLKNKKQENIIKYKVNKNILLGGKIINPSKFIKVYEKMLKEYNLNNSLFGETIKIIFNPNYTIMDINLLKNIFLNFNYRKIYTVNENKYYKLNSKNAYLNIYDSYIILTYQNEYKKTLVIYLPTTYFLNIKDLMQYIKYRIGDRELLIIGYGDWLNEIFNNFEALYHNQTYLFSNHETYLIDSAEG